MRDGRGEKEDVLCLTAMRPKKDWDGVRESNECSARAAREWKKQSRRTQPLNQQFLRNDGATEPTSQSLLVSLESPEKVRRTESLACAINVNTSSSLFRSIPSASHSFCHLTRLARTWMRSALKSARSETSVDLSNARGGVR